LKGFYLLFIFFLFATSQLVAQLYTVKNFNHKDGLNFSNLTSCVQTKDGFLWIATKNSGLLKYDGKQFTENHFSATDNHHEITSLAKDQDNHVYFSSRYKGVYKVNGNTCKLIYRSYRSVGDYASIFSFQSSLVFVCDNAIFLHQGGTVVDQKKSPSRNVKIQVTQFIEIPGGAILLTKTGHYFISSKDKKISPLHSYLKKGEKELSPYLFGFFSNHKLVLYTEKLEESYEVIFDDKGEIASKAQKHKISPLANPDVVVRSSYDAVHHKQYFITQQNDLYYSSDNTEIRFTPNQAEKLINCVSITPDQNGDMWICSNLKGLYKISLEPFTKMEAHPVYQNTLICLYYKSPSGITIVGSESEGTNVDFDGTGFIRANFVATSACELNGILYLATANGVKTVNSHTKKIESLLPIELLNKKILFVFSDGKSIWMGTANQGLVQFDPLKKEVRVSQNLFSGFPSNFYTAQKSFDEKSIIFGTNNGIHQFNLESNSFNSLGNYSPSLGTKSQLSTIDKFGTLWFTLNHGLIGFTKNGNTIVHDHANFVSTNFRTLNSDSFGNLIIGTNKGISILQVNKKGQVVQAKNYDGQTGFSGYETRMNAQFQSATDIYVGTVEGLYLINTSVLQQIPIPAKPFTKKEKSIHNSNSQHQKYFVFTYKVNNPKINDIQYSYRLVGLKNQWSHPSLQTSVSFSDLPDHTYLFQVKATSDGLHFSEVSSLKIQVSSPFWTSNFFIILMILIFTFLNIFFLNKIKSFDSKTIFSNKDNALTGKLIPRIILFGALLNSAAHGICHRIDPAIPYHGPFTISVACLLFFIYFLSRKMVTIGSIRTYKTLLILAYSIAICQNFTALYLSSLHPYFIIITTITSALIPFIFEKLRSSILFSILVLLVSCLCFIVLKDTLFDKYLFITITIFTVCLSIFVTYLRHDSISKLLFISGVINKGDVITIAFDVETKISYVSENISSFIDSTHDALLGKHLSVLSTFITKDHQLLTAIENSELFEDGKKYQIPFLSKTKEALWIEWSCKVFSNDVKILLGADVTKKMELETSYELLVQNAEDFIYQCDSAGHFVFLNDQALAKTGYSEQELIGQNMSTVVVPKFRKEVASFYKNHFQLEQDSSYHEFPITTKKGENIWLGQHVTTLYEVGSREKIKGFLALARDITEKRKQEKIIEEQQKDITSSIHYAKRIQINLLPDLKKFESHFTESFVLYRPKDIVSGDFYWMEHFDNTTVLAVADCTGHGVPGSFMTLLGINLLNSIVLEGHLLSPAAILDKLDEKLMHVLPRGLGENKVNDGMEMTICVFNHQNKTLTYGCAGSRFLILKEEVFTLCKLDSKHIGDYRQTDFRGYAERNLALNQKDILYFFTDGFQDQFGGEKNKKFNFKRLLSLLESTRIKTLPEQKEILQKELKDWVGDYEQTDDITVVGLKV
jgi:PAS domain S-box-containing protein